jgi:hypothetical protein
VLANALELNTTVTCFDLSCACVVRACMLPCSVYSAFEIVPCARGVPDNGIGDTGATAIAKALKVNLTITRLKLWRERRAREPRH